MADSLDFKANGFHVATDIETGALPSLPVEDEECAAPPLTVARTRGRPKGSKSKVTREAREYLQKYGVVAVEVLCRMAAGRPLYGEPDASGRRQKRYPSLDMQFEAAKTLADRLIPTLKASEVVADVRQHSVAEVFVSASDDEEDTSALAKLQRHIDRIRERAGRLVIDADPAQNLTAEQRVAPPSLSQDEAKVKEKAMPLEIMAHVAPEWPARDGSRCYRLVERRTGYVLGIGRDVARTAAQRLAEELHPAGSKFTVTFEDKSSAPLIGVVGEAAS